jgi:type I restriction enzyme M protein
MKRMIAVLEKYRYKYDPANLFTRFMEYVITGFDQTFSPADKPFSQEEGQACHELMSAWILVMNDKLKSREWYDTLGEVYMEYISGSGKKHATGQYFTPMYICDFMTKIVAPGEHAGESVLDNACGSGRMLLAAHAEHPGNYCCAQDMDRMCCLMAVCNFIIHGVNGEVVWGNSLDPSDYREGWRTNELLHTIGVPCCRKMDMMESRTYRAGLSLLKKHQEETSNKDTSPQGKANKSVSPDGQMNLFYFDANDETIYNE